MARLLHDESMRHAKYIIVMIFCGLGQFWPVPAIAMTPPDCEAIAAQLGAQAGLPEGLLPAIARIESGLALKGGTRAWPWTLNTGGQGHYFETNADAMTFLQSVLQNGQRNIDIGCMQINYHWHSENFQSVAAMMDPVQNITYAIEFLKSLRAQSGSWSAAVQRYHSNDPTRGNAYHERFLAALDGVRNGQTGQASFAHASFATDTPDNAAMASDVGGLYATYLGGEDSPLVPGISTLGSTDLEEAYESLLAVLAVADAEATEPVLAPVELVERVKRGEIGRRWQDVEGFRNFFRSQPAG